MLKKGQDPKEMLIEICKVNKKFIYLIYLYSLIVYIGKTDYKDVKLKQVNENYDFRISLKT